MYLIVEILSGAEIIAATLSGAGQQRLLEFVAENGIRFEVSAY